MLDVELVLDLVMVLGKVLHMMNTRDTLILAGYFRVKEIFFLSKHIF